MVRERFLRGENEKKKRLELSLYSHDLSREILTRNGKAPLSSEIPEDMLAAFQKGSTTDRDAYWQEVSPEENFGQQMLAWIGKKDAPGISIAQWVDKQTDSDVLLILQEIGLKGDPQSREKDEKDEGLQKLVGTINVDLAKKGEDPLSVGTLTESQLRSLIFYSHYLTGEKETHDAKELINTVVKVANDESGGGLEPTIKILQKVTPLFAIAGEKAQHVLGALVVAKTHALESHDKLNQAESGKELSEDETAVMEFLQKYHEKYVPEALPAGKPADIEKVYAALTPPAKKGHAYWIEKPIPSGWAKSLSKEGVKNLEQTHSLFKDDGNENEAIFAPTATLKEDERFTNALQVSDESQLFALSSIASAQAESQASLYRELSEVVIRAHKENPQLLEAFLKAQSDDSLYALAEADAEKARRVIDQRVTGMQEAYDTQAAAIAPGINLHDLNAQAALSESQRQQLQELTRHMQGAIMQEVYGSLKEEDRLVAIVGKITEQIGIEHTVDIPTTVTGWQERIGKLQEVLTASPLTLTPEQISQIEFLSYSVNTPKAIEMLQGTVAVDTSSPISAPVQPVTHEQTEKEETAPTVPSEAHDETPVIAEDVMDLEERSDTFSLTLSDFFTQFDNWEVQLLPMGITPRRTDIAVAEPTKLAEFSTAAEPMERFVMTDKRKHIAFLQLKRNSQTHASELRFNTDNPFLALLLRSNTLSLYAFNALQQGDNNILGPSTLFAYAMEAGKNAEDKSALVKHLFLQVGKTYEEHPDIGSALRQFLARLGRKSPYARDSLQSGYAGRLFGSQEQIVNRVKELSGKISNNEALTLEDLHDMSVYSLPFNLQYLAQRMTETYRVRSASVNLSANPEIPGQE
ncbi:MAG TPA: hypothetical protein VLB73_00525 [Patescibacteria group bacterium]|nr:hypothetical protein [Patescibacteria group bacterium]